MSKRLWNIEIKGEGWSPEFSLFVAAGDIRKTLAMVAQCNPMKEVVLSAMARNRIVVIAKEDGTVKVVRECDDIGEFYTDIDSQTAHDWKEIQEFHVEEEF